MKTLYCGISSKYIHTMPAGWFLAEYLKSKDITIDESYYNVNQNYDEVLNKILNYKADTLLISVYIFDVNFVNKLIKDIKMVSPKTIIIVGGPEVDKDFENVDHIIIGEGEIALYKLLSNQINNKVIYEELITNLNDIPSPYTEKRIKESDNKLLYYESSRGCPFKCSYCMASLSTGVRYFSIERVKKDLRRIVRLGTKIVKFTDRTFNAHIKRTNTLLQFILDEFYNDDVCFHFEVGADLFNQSTLNLLKQMPIGRVQIEAGVQTLNTQVQKAINRTFNRENFENNIKKILSFNNIHTHLDLIAGLPQENYNSFKESFNGVMRMQPHVLQLGFLKFLKGTPLDNNYNANHYKTAPYEVIDTPYITSDELDILRGIDTVIDRMYNSNKFKNSLIEIFKHYNNYYDMYYDISEFLINKGIDKCIQEFTLYNAILGFMTNLGIVNAIDLLKLDYLLTNKSRILPPCLKVPYTKEFKKFLKKHKPNKDYLLSEFKTMPNIKRDDNLYVKFNYKNRNEINNEFNYEILEKSYLD